MQLLLYGREGCHLCDRMHEELDELFGGQAPVQVIDVDDHPGLASRHGLRVPVLELAGEELCHGRLDRAALRRIEAARGR